MKITILAVGKIKEKFFVQALMEYQKRLSRYCTLQIIEVADEKTPDNASQNVETMIKDKEALKILKYCKEHDAYKIALAIEGKMYDSVSFSQRIESLGVQGKSHIVFIIGGSLGLSEQILDMVDEKISFSKMTFPHQMMRVILLEQVYRAYRIMNKEPYHK